MQLLSQSSLLACPWSQGRSFYIHTNRHSFSQIILSHLSLRKWTMYVWILPTFVLGHYSCYFYSSLVRLRLYPYLYLTHSTVVPWQHSFYFCSLTTLLFCTQPKTETLKWSIAIKFFFLFWHHPMANSKSAKYIMLHYPRH